MLKIFKKLKNTKYKNKKQGIALVIAITVTTLLLSVSLSISNIVLRQIKITNINNASKPAFFIADSAIECAFYYDTVAIFDVSDLDLDTNKVFETSIFGKNGYDYAIEQIRCGDYGTAPDVGAPLNLITSYDSISEKQLTTFDIGYGDMCAKVEVTKTDTETNITARGYNTGVDAGNNECDLTDLDTRRLVERGLTIKY